MSKKVFYVRIVGSGLLLTFRATSHEIMGLPAGTYHKFVFENGTTVYFNDFGVRSVQISDTEEGLN